MGVVDDLVPDVDGGAVAGDRLLDNMDGPVDARAEAARTGQQHLERRAMGWVRAHVGKLG